MKLRNINIGGANRGGRELTRALLASGVTPEVVGITDPKPNRARELGETYERAGAKVVTLEEPCESGMEKLDPEAPIVLAVDTVAPMATVLSARTRQMVLTQLVGRAAGHTVDDPAAIFAMEVSAVPGREGERADVARFLEGIARVTPAQSSAVMRDSGFDAAALHAMRREVSEATVRERLLDLPRVREADHLAHLRWAGESFPLAVREAEGPLPLRREQALDLAIPGKSAVALLAPDRVDVFVIDRDAPGRAYVQMYVPFAAPQVAVPEVVPARPRVIGVATVAPPVRLPSRTRPPRPSSGPGIRLGSALATFAALAFAPATVTD